MEMSTNTADRSATNEAAAAKREVKTLAVTVPADLAAKVEALAEREGRSVSGVFGDALREYSEDFIFRSLADVRAYAATRNPRGYTEQDIPRLIKEVRAEQDKVSALRDAKHLDRRPGHECLDIRFTV